MDSDDDDLLRDLLTYECPHTGKRRTAGCVNGQLFQKCLGGISIKQMGNWFFCGNMFLGLGLPNIFSNHLGKWRWNLIRTMSLCSWTTFHVTVTIRVNQPRTKQPKVLPLCNSIRQPLLSCAKLLDMLCLFFFWGVGWRKCGISLVTRGSPNDVLPKDSGATLASLAESFTADHFDWDLVKPYGLLNRCLLAKQAEPVTAGTLLSHCREKVTVFREKMGIRLCIFKVGITSYPPRRYLGYLDQGFQAMHIIAVSSSIDLINMLEAALVMEFHQHVGCRNKKGTGGEGALSKKARAPPPYYAYVTGGRADQHRRVGWWPQVVITRVEKYGGVWVARVCVRRLRKSACDIRNSSIVSPTVFTVCCNVQLWAHMMAVALCSCSEACCKHVVQVARHEVECNPNSSRAMREFASIREEDAEVGARRVLVEYGFSAPIPISFLDLGEERHLKKFPWIKFSSWAQHLLNIGILPRVFVGVNSLATMKLVLTEFWKRYEEMDPGHPVFGLARAGEISFDLLVPFYSHSDEGTTFRDSSLWVLNVHGVIGRGTRSFLKAGKHRSPVHRNAQGLNYVGCTWSTHCLIATMMKCVASQETLDTLISAFAEDVNFLLQTGVSNGAETIRFYHLATKGDLPALQKVGRLTRTFSHCPRAASSRTPCRGVCWLCLAGQERDDAANRQAYPFEDVTMDPCWEPTIGTEVPWEVAPAILNHLPLDDGRAIAFFQTDLFHNCHLGCLKSFTSSAIVAIVEASSIECLAHCTSVEQKFQTLSRLYHAYFSDRGVKPWVTDLNRDMVCWPMSSACPAAKWNKGMGTVQVMRFVDWFAQTHLSGSEDPDMKAIASWLHRIFCFWLQS